MDHEIVSLVAAFVEAYAALREANQVVLGFLQLERVHVKLLVNVAGVEQEGVGGDAEQGLCQLGDAGDSEVLQVLTCQNDAGFLLSHPLHEVADIFNGGEIGQK